MTSMLPQGAAAKTSVAIVAPSAYLLGGVQTWLDYLVPGLESADWDVTVLLVDGVYSDAHLYLQQHPFRSALLVANPTGSREGRIRSLTRAIQAVGPDLVLAVNIADVYSAVSRVRVETGRGPKVAMALHGLQPCFFQDLVGLRTILDGVVCTNRLATAAAVTISGVAPERACYAPCGVSVGELPGPIIHGERLDLLYAGRLDFDEKRVMDLPIILSKLNQKEIDFRIRLAGAGPAETALRQALAEFGDKVEFVGVLDGPTLRNGFYKPGSVVLILSPRETGPLVAWEAMAAGVAVVTARFVGIGLEASLQDGENCLTFPVGDADTAAQRLAELVNPRRRELLIQAGHQMVRERYTLEVSLRMWDQAMRHILAMPLLLSAARVAAPPVAGRLDRFFGVSLAETIRRFLGLGFAHRDPGGEWPHSYGNDQDADLLSRLSAMDRATGHRTQGK